MYTHIEEKKKSHPSGGFFYLLDDGCYYRMAGDESFQLLRTIYIMRFCREMRSPLLLLLL